VHPRPRHLFSLFYQVEIRYRHLPQKQPRARPAHLFSLFYQVEIRHR